jgi:hypothetical protein
MEIEQYRTHDKRKDSRRRLSGYPQLEFSGQSPIDVKAMDVSCSGLGIVAQFNPPPLTSCNVTFVLPFNPNRPATVSAVAVVMHSIYSQENEGFKVGLLFHNLEVNTVNLLLNYVRS